MRQTDFSLVMEGRQRARVAATHPEQSPEQLPGPTEPASCKDGPSNSQEVLMEQGSDLRRHRCSQGPGGRRRPPHRRQVGGLPRPGGDPQAGLPAEGPPTGHGVAGGFGRIGTAPCGSPGDQGGSRGRRQPPPGAGLRQGHLGSWPRPTLWTRRSWPTSPKRSDRPCALCGMPRPRLSTPWLPEGTR